MAIRRTDREKLEACLPAVLEFVLQEGTGSTSISAQLRRLLGPGWTLMTAFQWLTGKAAWQAIDAMKDGSSAGGVSKDTAMLLVKTAVDVCSGLDASGGAELSMDRLRKAMPDHLKRATGVQ